MPGTHTVTTEFDEEDVIILEAIKEITEMRINRTNQNILEGTEDPTNKTLHNLDMKSLKENVKDIQIFGDGEMFQVLYKVSSKKEGWSKSTKAMEIMGVGCIVQVTTQQGGSIAEAVTFVPGVQIIDHGVNGRELVGIEKNNEAKTNE